MTITGYQFDKMKVTPEADAMLYHSLGAKQNHVINGVGSNLSATATGLNIYVNPGASVVFGRLLTVNDQESLTVQANTTGYVCQTIDLTETNTATGTPGSGDYATVNNQYRLEVVNELTQQDLLQDGQVYTFPLYTYTASGTSVTLKKVDKSFTEDVLTKTQADELYPAKSKGTVLWSGLSTLNSSHTITPSKSLNDCQNGWLLVFAPYNGTSALNYDVTTSFVPKGQTRLTMEQVYNGSIWTVKRYQCTNTTIVGHGSNVGADQIKAALIEVCEV